MAEYGGSYDAFCRVTAMGKLVDAPKVLAPVQRGSMVEVELDVKGEIIPVQAFGATADKLSGAKKGQTVRIDGPLKRYTWKTGGYRDRERMVVVCEEVRMHRI